MGALYEEWRKLSPKLECEVFRAEADMYEQEEREYEECLAERERSFRLFLLEKEHTFQSSENDKKLNALNNFADSIKLLAEAIIISATSNK